MKQENFLHSFGEIDPAYIEEADATITSQSVASVRSRRHRFPVALVAAIMCLLLMGAGVASVIYGGSIQSWFGHYFERMTGQEMEEGQTALIDHLSQDIGQSQTVGDVTVTVDSATVGDDSFYLLIRVEGMDFSNRNSYGFDGCTMNISPDPLEEAGGSAGYGVQCHGIDGDGAALLLIDYSYLQDIVFETNTAPLRVSLMLEDLTQNGHTDRRKLLQEGQWSFEFTIDRSQPPVSMSLPDTEVMLMDLNAKAETPVLLTNIELTNTGLRFQFDGRGGSIAVELHIEVILKSGASVGISSGSGSEMQNSTIFLNTYQWLVPIDIEDVVAIRFGGTDIPINP